MVLKEKLNLINLKIIAALAISIANISQSQQPCNAFLFACC